MYSKKAVWTGLTVCIAIIISLSVSLIVIINKNVSPVMTTEETQATEKPVETRETVKPEETRATEKPKEKLPTIKTNEQGVALPSLNLPDDNPIDDTLYEISSICRTTDQMKRNANMWCEAWRAEVINAYALLIEKCAFYDIRGYLIAAEAEFLAFTENFYNISYASPLWTNAFDKDATEYIWLGGRVTPILVMDDITDRYKAHAMELIDLLFWSGTEYEFVFDADKAWDEWNSELGIDTP